MQVSDFTAKVVLASRSKQGGPDIITVHCHYPRMIHSEVMTHRVFSRNARSSRAVPTKKLVAEPIYIPHFMKNQAGMQSFEEFDLAELAHIQEEWEAFARKTQLFQEWLVAKGVHKQWANRPGEWFGYIDTLITSTEWSNWFNLRDHTAAMPEIQKLAREMDREFKNVIKNAKYQILEPGDWHVPYSDLNYPSLEEGEGYKNHYIDEQLKLSVARCARISYAPFDGNALIDKEIERYNLLRYANPIHASPFEHQAQNVSSKNYFTGGQADAYITSNLSFPWLQYRKVIGE